MSPSPSATRLVTLLLALFFFVAGCAHLGIGSSEEPAPETEPTQPAVEAGPERIGPLGPEVEELDRSLLEEAEAHFRAGRYYQAEFLFQRYLTLADGIEVDNGSIFGPDNDVPATQEALWGLAMLHLLPDSPLEDRERGMVSLERLSEEYGDTVRGAQARWVLEILDELHMVQAQMDEQAELLRQLTETVEQLRRIDLLRRPTGGRSSDTLPTMSERR